eukprot:m.188842 g.188842  ORF g.188842 m.188842 type:complete len:383 (-) comp10032_c1_seq8:855-2003(-)
MKRTSAFAALLRRGTSSRSAHTGVSASPSSPLLRGPTRSPSPSAAKGAHEVTQSIRYGTRWQYARAELKHKQVRKKKRPDNDEDSDSDGPARLPAADAVRTKVRVPPVPSSPSSAGSAGPPSHSSDPVSDASTKHASRVARSLTIVSHSDEVDGRPVRKVIRFFSSSQPDGSHDKVPAERTSRSTTKGAKPGSITVVATLSGKTTGKTSRQVRQTAEPQHTGKSKQPKQPQLSKQPNSKMTNSTAPKGQQLASGGGSASGHSSRGKRSNRSPKPQSQNGILFRDMHITIPAGQKRQVSISSSEDGSSRAGSSQGRATRPATNPTGTQPSNHSQSHHSGRPASVSGRTSTHSDRSVKSAQYVSLGSSFHTTTPRQGTREVIRL